MTFFREPRLKSGLWRSFPGPDWLEARSLRAVEVLVRLAGQERHEVAAEHEAVEDRYGVAEPSLSRAAEGGELLVAELPVERGGDPRPVFQRSNVPEPLPELGTGDLGGGGVFHQVADTHGTLPLE